MTAHKPSREVIRWSPRRGRRTVPVTLVAIHESVGITNAWDLALFCERQGVSYHDLADNTQLVHTVPFDSVAWHLRGGNPRAVGLCLTTPKPGYSRSEWLGPQVNKVASAAWWVARACALFGLPIRHLNHPQIRAAAGGSKRDGGALMHVDYTWATRDGNHTDPRNFPMDVCIQWAQAISGPSPEGGIEDMALDTKFRGWNGGDVTIEQWMNALSQALANVPVGVWEHSIDNPYGNKVAVKHVVSALEARLIRVEASVADMATRLPAPPAPPKPSDKRG